MNIKTSSYWINQQEISYYLSDIKKYPTISKNDEILLFEKIKKGDQAAKNTIIKSNLRFVIAVAKKYQYSGIELPDLINQGNLGLCIAVDKYDTEQTDVRFLSYAVWWIRQSIMKLLNEASRGIRMPVNKINIMLKNNKEINTDHEFKIEENTIDIPVIESLDRQIGEDGGDLYDIIPYSDSDSPENGLDIEKENLSKDLNNIVDSLTKVEQIIIKNYFGLIGDQKTLQEIADDLCLTKERVRQIKEKAIKKLRDSSFKLFELI